ncbi:acyltransferase [Actinoplanes sp. NPDC049118]|uniref:acyltransferase n=1 Tax=Actinoplanes sp. NPDC049118 TaxID=3155769 RepID=UPI0033F27D07
MVTTLRGSDITTYSDANGNTITGTPITNNNAVIEFMGSNCHVTFDDTFTLHGKISFRRDNGTVRMGRRSSFRGLMSLGLDCSVTFGDSVYCGLNLQITTAEATSVTLGNDLLIANNCVIRSDDSHPIYDGVTGNRINPSASITVMDHVWLGQESLLMPGARIGKGSVIGARSMVTKSRPVPAHCIAIGAPARVQRTKIKWTRKHLQVSDDIPDSIPSVFSADDVRPARAAHTVRRRPVRRWARSFLGALRS